MVRVILNNVTGTNHFAFYQVILFVTYILLLKNTIYMPPLKLQFPWYNEVVPKLFESTEPLGAHCTFMDPHVHINLKHICIKSFI
jgi:hypothetical protein